MPRAARAKSETGLYHIMFRGLSDKAFEYPWLGCAGMGNQTLLTDDIGKLTVLKNDELIQYVTQPAKTDHLDTTEKKRLTDREAIEQLKSLSRGANPQVRSA